MKFLGYQILAIGIIWSGMAFFFKNMDQAGKIIFYVVTSWLLFLVVLLVKGYFKKESYDPSEEDKQE